FRDTQAARPGSAILSRINLHGARCCHFREALSPHIDITPNNGNAHYGLYERILHGPNKRTTGFGCSATNRHFFQVYNREYRRAHRKGLCNRSKHSRTRCDLSSTGYDSWQGPTHSQSYSLGPDGKEYEL